VVDRAEPILDCEGTLAQQGEPDTRETEAVDPLIGRRVRDFLIRERIGRGGMGAVYRADHILLHEPRALKVIRAELFRHVPHAVERFEREARIAVKLRHPNLVLLHDFFVEDGDHFLVMEYVVGQSLAELLHARGALSTAEICSIGAQCCAGLAHAHELGIVHRDLSPENVMLTPTPDGPAVKIIDFGVARAALSTEATQRIQNATLTRAGDFIGKPRYASPEQAGSLRPGEDLDGRSDLYSLGLVLYEMATGVLPFHSESAIGYLALQLYQDPPAPSKVRPELNVSPQLERVILRCLKKDRSQRYASCAELGRALEDVSRSNLARLQRPSATPRARGMAVSVTAAGLALAVGAAAAWRWDQSRRANPPPAAVVESPAPVVAKQSPPQQLKPVPVPEVKPAPAPVPAPTPAPTPQAEVKKAEPVTPAPAPTPTPTPAPAQAPTPAPVAKATPAPTPKPAPPAVVDSAAFSSPAQMQTAFDQALAYEGKHSSDEAVANWKRFRARHPSAELDDKAKRRITELTLGGMKSFP
jgi:eukaryotic-like serine/threonine-protein kinase